MQEKIEKKLLLLAQKAYKQGEIPVSAILVKNNKIISSAYNKRQRTHDVTKHAEILVIQKATKKLKDWRLDNCELYVTLKPCSMCTEIIKQSRISKVYFYIDKPINKKEYNKTEFINLKVKTYTQFVQLLQNFFENKR